MTVPTTGAGPLSPSYAPPEDAYNAVTDGGCYANGTNDDSALLAAAMDAAILAEQNLYLPAGTYLLNSTVFVPTGLYMYGDGDTSILDSRDEYGLEIEDEAAGITFKDFKLKGVYATSHSAVVVAYGYSLAGITLDNVTIVDWGYCGFYGAAASTITNATFTGCTMSHLGDFGIHHGSGGSSATWTVTDCDISDCTGDGNEPPHGIYCHDIDGFECTGTTVSYIGHDQDEDGYGWSGFEWDNCTDIVIAYCTAHHCDDGFEGGVSGGEGFTFLGTCDAVLTNCVATVENSYGYYKCYVTVPADVVIDGTNSGTILVYP